MNEFYVFLIFKFSSVLLKKMPDESCRVCGGMLIDFAQCAGCKKIIAMICKSCRTKTPEQFHSECLVMLNSTNVGSTGLLNSLNPVTLA